MPEMQVCFQNIMQECAKCMNNDSLILLSLRNELIVSRTALS